uniref:Cupin 2 conserved barrel domain protein n=1 Tax=Thiomonas intermedia (strain K12) TaxID=75379 RepID=D5X2H1_THIK1
MPAQGAHHTLYQIGPLENLDRHNYRGVPGKYFVGDNLGLTGCEVSLNRLPAGRGMPFVHAHKKNEELYVVLRGTGFFYVDGEEFPVSEGTLVRVAPEGARVITAGSEDLYFICIQVEANSLTQATLEDGYRVDVCASWMKD